MEQNEITEFGMLLGAGDTEDNTPDVGDAVSMTSAESVSILIEEFGAIREVRNGTYNRLHSLISGCCDIDEANRLLEDGESLFVRTNFSAEDIAANTTKGGKIKMSKLLPNDYQSAKSILLRAKADGLPMFDDDGNQLGKSALSAAVSGKTPKTAQQKLDAALANALKYAREVYGDNAQFVTVTDGAGNMLQEVKA